MWKHKTKWLVRGGRKVKCYLCGKKILSKGDLFLFHGDTGYYSHQSCQAESTTISGNERRRAVKKIAVGAAVVGAIAAGAGKLIDISSQSKGSNSPAAQTILTSQGLIPPALTSDPANPVPGQMWYRSDAGVMAHFDGVQNRVVYSSEINDGNVYVTSKGIVNGLSVLPNDGKGGFGPDTTLNATAPGQYGSPYTETGGIDEAWKFSPDIFCSGSINISTSITAPSNSHISITGDSNTLITATANMTSILSFTSSTNKYIAINTIALNGNYFPNGTINVSYGIYVTNDAITNIHGYYPENFTSSPLYINGTGNVYILNYMDSALSYAASVYNEPSITIIGGGGSTVFISDSFLQYPLNVSGTPYFLYVLNSGIVGVQNSSQNAYFINCWLAAVDYLPSGQDFAYTIMSSGFISLINCDIEANSVAGNVEKPFYMFYLSSATSNSQTYYPILNVTNCNIDWETITPSDYTSLTMTQIIDSNAVVNIKKSIIRLNTTGTLTELSYSSGVTNISYFAEFLQTISPGMTFTRYYTTPTLSTNPPVSGTTYQNTNPYDIRLKIPVTYSPTSSAAATLATGTSSSSTVTTSTKVSYPAGITTGIINTYEMVVPAGQYFELVATNATIGTVEVQAA